MPQYEKSSSSSKLLQDTTLKYIRPSNTQSPTDDYAKYGGPGQVRRLCSFYHESLRTRIQINGCKSAISSYTALKLGEQALKSYLKITCEFQLHISPNKKVSVAKDCG